MILVDSRVGSRELFPIIKSIGAPCELAKLEYGDAAFSGQGPNGEIAVGCERKTLNDYLNCIDDSRYTAHQRPGMAALYDKSYLLLEGLWCAGNGNGMDGLLMQGYRNGASWGPLKTRGNHTVLYAKLYRHLMSVALSGVLVTVSNNLWHTAYNIVEMWKYYSKPWHSHRTLLETQKLAIPSLSGRPSLVRRWASELTDVGVVHGEAAAILFKTGVRLANSQESDWLALDRIGPKTAISIVKEIRDWK